jgi:hypothetical protein
MKASALLAFFAMTAIGIGAGNPSPAAVTHNPVSKPAVPDQIKAYCIDFNWARTGRAKKPFAKPGEWAESDPAAHVAWYKAMGANVIQTFAVSCNGYAWYKNGFVPEQPGLKHDFLREVVRLGHQENMLVFGYFCAAANVKWVMDNPELNYPQKIQMKGDQPQSTGPKKCVVYTDEYLDYLSKAVKDAVGTTGIDGIMIDWLWMPERKPASRDDPAVGWIEAEKKLYAQLMGEPFPGKDQLTKDKETEYSRKAIERCWDTIYKSAKEANPDCIVWLTVSNMKHAHVVNSKLFKQADWLMNEGGAMEVSPQLKAQIKPDTKLISCLAAWNGKDPSTVIPEAHKHGVGLYGFTAPSPGKGGLVNLEKFMTKPIEELKGDERNISALARTYHGVDSEAKWTGSGFDPQGGE